ncbi:MAG: retroviral-like aspartic protease family protein [Bacteroidales bacterium]|nr:retroviral-like aspartic protease family protein [Bacteroidales bacterium]
MIECKAFNLTSNKGLLAALFTQCHIGIAFDPNSGQLPPQLVNFNALWDTGATGTVITSRVVDALGLKPTGQQRVFHADGESNVNTYHICLRLPNEVGFPIIKATEGKLNGFDVLIGMDIITQGDFSITNFQGKTSFSFRVPSIGHVDFVNEITSSTPARSSKVGRNNPCPCGSTKKYKFCCGQNH